MSLHSTPAAARTRVETLSRRGFLAAAGAGALALAVGASPRAAGAAETSYPVRFLWDFPMTGYATYPHHNGFLDQGRHLVIRKRITGSTDTTNHLHLCHLESGETIPLPAGPHGRRIIGGYWDVHYASGLLIQAESQNQAQIDGVAPRVWALDVQEFLTTGSATWEVVWQIPAALGGIKYADDSASINRYATKLALSVLCGPADDPGIPGDQHSKVVEIDLATGAWDVRADQQKTLNHVHFSPHDPEWIIFTREGDSTLHKERVWGYHPVHQPTGANIVPQILSDGTVLRLSHERAAWDSNSVVVINYEGGHSLWRGFFDGREPELLATGNFVHCDISRDGRYVVVDDGGRPAGKLQLVDLAKDNALTVLVDPAYQGSAHPRHAHPIFSPDGRYVLWNESDPASPYTGGLTIGVLDLRPDGYRDATIIFGTTDSGVPNRSTSDGTTFLDAVDPGQPFASRSAFLRKVTTVCREWHSSGLLEPSERSAVLRAATTSRLGHR
ncbi:twin-arginine translocation signal domain-containing protein [Jiangella rhizosphaerae]|uniref:Twin-arginine translocation signal domain-containing protein n=1 Tax=Jiangella rhizosphaerae TaxID=2293569 RepID=A0A418KXL5_9ACTN|nr:twin-arginine translocation signal domain-containing protein [Jiangella rhizosphaerae]RIQ37816.1 twin-arginine translocation signal domain-containing protein [Jiangella rhizosphaerae]